MCKFSNDLSTIIEMWIATILEDNLSISVKILKLYTLWSMNLVLDIYPS